MTGWSSDEKVNPAFKTPVGCLKQNSGEKVFKWQFFLHLADVLMSWNIKRLASLRYVETLFFTLHRNLCPTFSIGIHII